MLMRWPLLWGPCSDHNRLLIRCKAPAKLAPVEMLLLSCAGRRSTCPHPVHMFRCGMRLRAGMASRLRLPREMRSGPGQIAFLQWLCLAQSGPVHQSRMIWARDSPTPYWTKRLRPLNQPSMKWSFLPLGQRLEAACSDDKSHWSRPSMVVFTCQPPRRPLIKSLRRQPRRALRNRIH